MHFKLFVFGISYSMVWSPGNFPLPPRAIPIVRETCTPRPRGWVERNGKVTFEYWHGAGKGRRVQALDKLQDWLITTPLRVLIRCPETDTKKLRDAFEESDIQERSGSADYADIERFRVVLEGTDAGLLRYIDIWAEDLVDELQTVPNSYTGTLSTVNQATQTDEEATEDLAIALPSSSGVNLATPPCACESIAVTPQSTSSPQAEFVSYEFNVRVRVTKRLVPAARSGPVIIELPHNPMETLSSDLQLALPIASISNFLPTLPRETADPEVRFGDGEVGLVSLEQDTLAVTVETLGAFLNQKESSS